MFPGWEIKPILIQLKEKREERRRRIFRWPLAMHYTRNTNQLKFPWLAKDNDDQHSIDRYSLRSSSSLNSATKVEALSTCPLLVLISNPVFRWWNDIRMLCSFDFTAFSSSSNCTLGYIPSMLLPSNDRRTTLPTATSLCCCCHLKATHYLAFYCGLQFVLLLTIFVYMQKKNNRSSTGRAIIIIIL